MKRLNRRRAITGGAVAVIVFSAWLMIQARMENDLGVEFLPHESAEFWPLDHAWSWRLKPNLISKSQAKVLLRTTQSELPPGTTPSLNDSWHGIVC